MQKKKIYVAHAPDFRKSNPYQHLWADSVEGEFIASSFFTNKKKAMPFIRYFFPRRKQTDIFHLHWINPFVNGKNNIRFLFSTVKFLLDLLLVRIIGVKIVWTIHNHDVHDSKINHSLFLLLKRGVLNLVNKVVVLNQEDISPLINNFGVKKTAVFYIPHGNYKGVYNRSDETFFQQWRNECENKIVFLFFGLIRPYKGLAKLVEAWQVFQQNKQDVKLIIAGQFREEAFENTIKAKTSTDGSILLLSRFIEDKDVNELFSMVKVVVLPFEKINNSGSLVLALTFNKPIIAPLFPVVSEYLGEASTFCYPVEEERGLLNSLEKAYNEIDRIDIKSIESQNSSLDWSLLSSSIIEMYHTK